MKQIFLIAFALNANILFAQQYNLVTNSNFQEADIGKSPPCKVTGDNPSVFSDNILDWEDAQRHTLFSDDHSTPDWYDTSSCPYHGWPTLSPSNRFAGLYRFTNDWNEGIRTTLPIKLQGGKTYTLRLKVANTSLSQANEEVKIVAHVTKFADHRKANPASTVNVQLMNIASFDIPANSPKQWYNFQQSFTVPSDKGNVLEILVLTVDENLPSYYAFIDDAELFEGGPNICPEYFLIENKLYNYPELPYEASQFITAGYNVGVPTPDGNVIVKNAADVTYKAGQAVIMKDGFSVERGGIFHAYIAPCGSDCPSPVANAGPDITVNCNNDCYQVGSLPGYGMTYSWTSNPPSAVSYLSNSTISNPVACLPSTGYGMITYTLTVTNNCGTIANDEVIITPPFYLNISTGVNNGTKIPFGQSDPDWKLTQTPFSSSTLQSTFSANPSNPHWPTSTYSNWITMLVDANGNPINNPTTVPWGQYDFSYIFNISAAQYPNLDFDINIEEMNIDNVTSLQVNNYYVQGGVVYNPNNMLGPFNISNIPYFQSGQNVFKAVSSNSNDWQGLLIKGNIVGYCGEGNKPIYRNELVNVENKLVNGITPIIIPNPSDGRFIIQINNIKDGAEYKLEIYNLLGKQIHTSSEYSSRTEIDLTNQPKGIYLVKITTVAGQTFMEKVIVQ